MAVSSASAWSDTTDIIASAVPTRLKSVRILVNQDASVASYVQLFDSADATPGTTVPTDVISVPSPTTGSRKMAYNVNFGGKYYGTGLTWFVATTATGATATTSTGAALKVDVHYTPGG